MADFIIGDYKYTRLGEPNTVLVGTVDNSKSAYEDIPTSVTYGGVEYSVTSMYLCFAYCTSLTQAPAIPSSVTSMKSCFLNCTSLTQAPVIPNSVTNMGSCFSGCTALEGDIYVYALNMVGGAVSECFKDTIQPIVLHSLNNNTETCDLLAATANNSNIYVNVRPETPITFNDTQMNYMTNVGLTPLYLQTNANLVQCEIPDLVNGGTITTNVNDALIDLCNRTPMSYVPAFEGTVIKSGVTFTNNGDGSFTVNGTAPTSERVSQSILNIHMFPPAKYRMTGGYRQQDGYLAYRTGTYVMWTNSKGLTGYPSFASNSNTSDFVNAVSVNVTFEISAGQTVDNVTFAPVITKVGDV